MDNEIASDGDARLGATEVSCRAFDGLSLETTPGAVLADVAPGGFWGARWTDDRRKWTAERDDILAQMWTAGASRDDILAAVNALPGPKIVSGKAVKSRAGDRDLHRPAGWLAKSARLSSGTKDYWSPEREAYLRAYYHDKATHLEEHRVVLNTMPGRPIVSAKTINKKARRMGLSRVYGPGPDVRAKKLAPHPGAQRGFSPRASAKGNPAGESTEAGDRAAEARPAPYTGNFALSSGTGARVDIIAGPVTSEPPPPYDPAAKGSVEARMDKARSMLRRKIEPSVIAANCRLPPHVVYRLIGELRAR